MPPAIVQETIIQPRHGWTLLNPRELWDYRDLILILVRRDFFARYAQSVLGPAWFILQPLLMTVVFNIIFSKVADIPTDGAPSFLFYLSNQLLWTYFAQSYTSSGTFLLSNANLFSKVYFPRLVVPLSGLLSGLLSLALQLLTFAAFWLWFKFFTPLGPQIHLHPLALVLLPLLILQTAAASLGAGLCLTSLTAKYRDLQHISQFILQAWFYATPIVYPLSRVPEAWRPLAALNPMTSITEATRILLLGTGTLTPALAAISLATTLLALLAGLFLFQRAERTFVDIA